MILVGPTNTASIDVGEGGEIDGAVGDALEERDELLGVLDWSDLGGAAGSEPEDDSVREDLVHDPAVARVLNEESGGAAHVAGAQDERRSEEAPGDDFAVGDEVRG